MSTEPAPAEAAEPLVARPWADRSNNQLLDRLEWAYNNSGGFEPEVVWEIARRLQLD